MSFPIRDLVLAHKGLPGGQKHVLAALAFWANDDGTRVYPKVQDVAERCGMSVRQVQRCIRSLEESGILVVVTMASGKRGQANHWKIDLEVLTGARVSICHPSGAKADGCQSVTPGAGTGDTLGADGCHFGRDGVTLMSPPIDNRQVSTHQGTSEDTRAREPVQRNLNLMSPITGDKPAYPPGFEMIWTELSRCPGFHALMNKHEAFLAYQALGDDRPTDAQFCAAARATARHLAALNATRPPTDPFPMRTPANWFGKRLYAQLLDETADAAAATEPVTLDAGCRVRLLAAGFGEAEIDAWFGQAEFSIEGDELHVSVLKPFVRNWIANHFQGRLEKGWADAGALTVKVVIRSQERAA